MESGSWERGRGRGWERGRGRGWARGRGRGPKKQWKGEVQSRERQHYSGELPRGLRGKEIGLWYRDRGRGKRNPDRTAKERTVAHIEGTQLELLESKLNILAKGLSSDDKKHESGILGILEKNIEGNTARDIQRDLAVRARARHGMISSKDGMMIKKEKVDYDPVIEKEAEVAENHRDACLSDIVSKSDSVIDHSKIEDIISIKSELKIENVKEEVSVSDFEELEMMYKKSDQNYCLPKKVVSDTTFSEQLARELISQQNSSKYKDMLQFRKKLPSYALKEEVVQLVTKNQVVVLTGETGCGKTTQVPQFLLEDCLTRLVGSTTRIVVTQPRRISAITVAERVARERGEICGEASTVGYQIRLESRLPRITGSILYCTTGIILTWLKTIPTLPSISHIVMDEVHERDIQSDFLMTVLRDLLPVRPDLKLILMSATLNAEKFSQYFGNCPIINIPGFTFPVEEFYLEDVLEMTKYKPHGKPSFDNNWRLKSKISRQQREYENDMSHWLRMLEDSGNYSQHTLDLLKSAECENLDMDLVAATVNYIHRQHREGAILVFVPGWEQISKVHKLLTEDRIYRLGDRVKVYPLHSMMPTVNQRDIFNVPPPGIRKVVVATNIAETSITIEDVVFVVDCGKIKMTNFNATTNMSTLQPEWVSLANAKQRRGRAGRVQPGQVYHLFTRGRKELLAEFLQPEMRRSRLDEVILQIKILQLGTAQKFLEQTLDPPDPGALKHSLELLQTMSALTVGDNTERLTPLGFHLAQLPMNPQTGKMILLAAIFSCLDPVLSVAASLSFKDAFMVPLGKEKAADLAKQELANNTRSDHLTLANVMSRYENSRSKSSFCWNNFLSESTLKMLLNMKHQFGEHLYRAKFIESEDILAKSANRNSDNESLVRAVICAGLYPNVARIKRVKTKPFLQTKLEGPTDRMLMFHPKSVLVDETSFKYPWVVYHLKIESANVYLWDASIVSPLALLFFGETVRIGQEKLSTGQIVETVSADDYVKFNCERRTSHVVQKLRLELDKILEKKIVNPGPTQWDSNREGKVLEAIVGLLDTEIVGGDSEEEDGNISN